MAEESDLLNIPKVGEETLKAFNSAAINSITDLLNYLPRKYEDYSNISEISKISPGDVSLRVRFSSVSNRRSRNGLLVTQALASDSSGSVACVWFKQPYRAKMLSPGEEFYLSGKFGLSAGRMSIVSPKVEKVSDFPVNTARILPKYPENKLLNSQIIKRALKQVFSSKDFELIETLPEWILKENGLSDIKTTIFDLHFPPSTERLSRARERYAFEEIFGLTLASQLNKQQNTGVEYTKIKFKPVFVKKFVQRLPFKLTDSQRRIAWQIFKDLQGDSPMNRLIEGDVGSGKTVIAAMASALVVDVGYQVAIVAPTEILAQQHFKNFIALFDDSVNTVLLTGSLTQKQKVQIHKDIADGKVDILIGTHAVLTEKVNFKNLSLIVFDEQHRFGVEQRQKLQKKQKIVPHILSLTATPIPRTLALTLYGELDISILNELPPGRLPVKTHVALSSSRQSVYQTVEQQLALGHQAFIVCPSIQESKVKTSQSVKTVFDELSSKLLKKRRLGMLHGKMPQREKDEIMKKFASRKIDALVSTSVIEVGIDFPNATTMVIESAECFGLAQIHQLRGRVGRGTSQSECYLIPSADQQTTIRLNYATSTSNGFKLAELDLSLRGPGALYGTLQHGILDFKVASLTDVALIEKAINSAKRFIDKNENLVQYKQLNSKVTALRKVTSLN